MSASKLAAPIPRRPASASDHPRNPAQRLPRRPHLPRPSRQQDSHGALTSAPIATDASQGVGQPRRRAKGSGGFESRPIRCIASEANARSSFHLPGAVADAPRPSLRTSRDGRRALRQVDRARVSVGRRVVVTAWPERVRARSRGRCRRRLGCPSSISTSTSGNRGGFRRLTTSGERRSANCSRGRSGSSTATTTSHSSNGSSARTRLCSLTRRGGSAHGVPSRAVYDVRLASSCRPAAMSPPGGGCAMNGASSGVSGELVARSANESSRSCRSTGSMLRCTCFVPGGRCADSLTACDGA